MDLTDISNSTHTHRVSSQSNQQDSNNQSNTTTYKESNQLILKKTITKWNLEQKITKQLSDGQIQYIKSCCKKLGKTPTELISETLDDFSTTQNRVWTLLSSQELRIIFYRLSELSLITDGQQNNLKRTYYGKEIGFYIARIKRPIKDVAELNYREYKFLIKSPDRFSLIPLNRPLFVGPNYEYGYKHQPL